MCNCNGNCNCNNNFHRVVTVTDDTTAVTLTTTNSTNIGDLEPYALIMRKNIITTAGVVPVQINVNGVNVPLKNKYGLQIQSNHVPLGVSYGAFVIDETDPTTPEPYVILFSTPRCRCNATD